MKKQWTATALVMTLGLAAPVLAQDDPLPPQDNPPQETQPEPAAKGSPVEREQAAQQATAIAGEEYVVQKGDTLSGLAERFLGSAGQWKQIADANAIQNPDMISVGMKLNIPQSGQGSTRDDSLERSRTQGTTGSSSAPAPDSKERDDLTNP